MLVQKDPKVQEAQMKVQITNKIPYKELEDEALCSELWCAMGQIVSHFSRTSTKVSNQIIPNKSLSSNVYFFGIRQADV